MRFAVFQKIFFAVIIFIVGLSETAHSLQNYEPEQLVNSGSVARESRIMLAKIIREDAARMESGGNIVGAVKLLTNAYNLDAINKDIAMDLKEIVRSIFLRAKNLYDAALMDVQFGRFKRAGDLLRIALDLVGDLDSNMRAELQAAMSTVESMEE